MAGANPKINAVTRMLNVAVFKASATSSFLSNNWIKCFMLFSSKKVYYLSTGCRCSPVYPFRYSFFFDAPADPN